MANRKKYEPIRISVKHIDDIFDIYKCEIAKAILKAVKYGYSKKLKTIDFAEITIAGAMTIHLEVDAREFDELIDKNIQILEQYEEYEICAEALKLKQKLNKNSKKRSLEN